MHAQLFRRDFSALWWQILQAFRLRIICLLPKSAWIPLLPGPTADTPHIEEQDGPQPFSISSKPDLSKILSPTNSEGYDKCGGLVSA